MGSWPIPGLDLDQVGQIRRTENTDVNMHVHTYVQYCSSVPFRETSLPHQLTDPRVCSYSNVQYCTPSLHSCATTHDRRASRGTAHTTASHCGSPSPLVPLSLLTVPPRLFPASPFRFDPSSPSAPRASPRCTIRTTPRTRRHGHPPDVVALLPRRPPPVPLPPGVGHPGGRRARRGGGVGGGVGGGGGPPRGGSRPMMVRCVGRKGGGREGAAGSVCFPAWLPVKNKGAGPVAPTAT